MYSYEEALEASTEYFRGDELAARVVVDKYLLRNNSKKLLEKTPVDMHNRIANELARVEEEKFKEPLTYEQIFDLLDGFHRFIPQGSAMYGIGNKEQYISLSNCFVLDSPHDAFSGIHWTDEQLSQISKRRGGVGIDISNLRPIDTPTKNSSRTSTGIVPFMERYSNSIREVGQSGRRGALMLCIDVTHPQVLDFATAKLDNTKVTGANISIRLTDKFLKAVKEKTAYEQKWPVDSDKPKFSKWVNANEVWNKIVECAHQSAEPGLLFWDNIIRESPADCYADKEYNTIATNPCSELPLCSLDSCRLGLMNLFTYVMNPFTKKASFDYQTFFEDVKLSQRLMDDIIDLELECIKRIQDKIQDDPEPEDVKERELKLWQKIERKCINGRRTGLGITALGDAIAALGFKYGSARSIQEVDDIYKVLKFGSYLSSVEMAKELGPFPLWDWKKEKDCPFIKRIISETIVLGDKKMGGEHIVKQIKKYGRRNIANLTNAPAGSVSLLSQTTSGIEPLFQISHIRKKKVNPSDEGARVDEVDQSGDSWMHFEVCHPKVLDWMHVNQNEEQTESPYFGSCAEDLSWKSRVKLQGIAQQHIDHAISSTLNLPNNVSVEEVKKIYEAAWKAGCKGITVYRKGSRSGVLVDKGQLEKSTARRPRELPCEIFHTSVKGTAYSVIVGKTEDGSLYEVFANRNGDMPSNLKTGRIIRRRGGLYVAEFNEDPEFILSPIMNGASEEEQAITRLTSLALRSGESVHTIVKQLEKVQGSMSNFTTSIARTLKKFIPNGTPEDELCSECGQNSLIRESGCVVCTQCGMSLCN